MTQGRNPDPESEPEPDDDHTLFEPPKEPSGPHPTPTPPPTRRDPAQDGGPNGTADDIPTTPQTPFTPLQPGGMGMDDPPSADLPSVSGIPFDSDGMAGLQPGQVLFDRYIVERQLGEGGMGTVWLVRHRELGSERALKLIVSGIARDPQVRLRFRREAQILDKLNHPNAVRVYDARMGRDVAFIEMEFVRGESLNQVLVPGEPMDLDWTVNLLDQLCDVLQAANDEGIIHRDLKPPNLMLVDGKQPGRKVLKLLDFGIAKIREGADDVHTMTGSFMGTPLYSSPEQIVGDRRVDARSDIYSVGLILYELLTGSRPFDGSMNAIIYKHTMVPPPPFAEVNPDVQVPPAVEAVVLKCLAKGPDDRPQSPRALAEMFHQALADGGVYTAPAPAPAPRKGPSTEAFEIGTKGRGRLARAARWAGLAVGLGLVAALLVAAVERWKPPSLRGGSAADLGTVVVTGVTDVPKTPGPGKASQAGTGTADPAVIAKWLARWKSQGFEPDPSEERHGGWPRTLLRIEDKMPFSRDPRGIYIPKGYVASSEPAADGYPRSLERAGATFKATFHRIIGGRPFRMGLVKPGDASILGADTPGPEVTLPSFYMQSTEVTNGQFESYMNALPDDICPEWREAYGKLKRGNELTELEAREYPATKIAWKYAADCAMANGGRLPIEAQWEYAARSEGQEFRHVWGVGPAPKQPGNFQYQASEVAHYLSDKTNQGIFDLEGNVQEWCRDVFKEYEPGMRPVTDRQSPPPPPSLAASDDLPMVLRGGSFVTGITSTINREGKKGNTVTKDIGFRIVLECPEGPPDP